MEQLTAAHTGKVLQELRNLIFNFEDNGYSMGKGGKAFLDYMKERELQAQEDIAKFEAAQIEYETKAKKCPNCGNAMKCYPVNTKPGNQVGGNWKSQWRCIPCDFNKFSLNSREVELKNYGIG